MNARLEQIVQVAIAEGILPAQAVTRTETERSWPVVLLTSFGAWLAAFPLIYVVQLLFGDRLMHAPIGFIVAALAICQAMILLRVKTVPVFVEQMAIPLLLAGCIVLGLTLYRDLPDQAAALIMTAVSLALARFLPQAWLRTVLGFAAGAFAIASVAPEWWGASPNAPLASLSMATALWLGMLWRLERRPLIPARYDIAAGWIIATLAGLAFWSGVTFLAEESLSDASLGTSHAVRAAVMQLMSILLACAGALWMARCWPSLRKPWCAIAAAVLMGLSWLMPSLGITFFILSVCATRRSWRLASAAGVTAAWIIGAFYYHLAYPLATKAVMMLAAGALLGATAWLALREGGVKPAWRAASDSGRARLGIALCALAVLAVVNFSIWQKQALIAEGQPVFIELAPADPRSLMQGDYMRLGFKLPRTEGIQFQRTDRPYAIGKLDARRVLTITRLTLDGAPAPGEFAVALTRSDRGWTVATDAWYFKEGGGAKLAQARYGEFRVTRDGRALLVGMRGPQLEALTP
jgi:uncharacterized membrane-anchored protein